MLSQTEKDALLELKKEGYSFTEAMAFIGGQRVGAPSTLKAKLLTEEKPKTPILPTSIKETAKDVFDVFKKPGERTLQAGQKIVDKAQSGDPKGALSEFVSGVGTTVGGFFTDTAKIGLSQEAEDGITQYGRDVGTAVANTDTAKKITDFYKTLSPDAQKQVGDAGRFTEGVLALFGGKTTTSAFKQTVATGQTAFKGALKLSDDVAKDLAKVGKAGAEGITVSKNLGLSPESIMQRVARINKTKQSDFKERAGEEVGEYLVNRNIFGTPDQIVDQLYSRMQSSMKRVDSGLAKIDGTYKDASLLRALRELAEREKKVGGIGTKSPDTARITELAKKHSKEGLTLEEANEVKRLYERGVKLDYLRDNVASGVEASNRVDGAMRDFIVRKASEKGFTTLGELNKETSLAKQLLDDIGAEYAGQAGNNAISLSDTIFLAEATGNPIAAAGFLAKKFAGSKTAMSAVAKLLSKETGSKANLPNVKVDNEPKLSGYLQYLQRQTSGGETPKPQ
jgi:uncharacterized protein YnzC (UPF0291/DUF896 family)